MACKLRCPNCGTMCKEKGDEMKVADGEYEVDSHQSETILHCMSCGAYIAVSLWEDE